jgi:hypothetical protein
MKSPENRKYFGQWTDRDSILYDFLPSGMKEWCPKMRTYSPTEDGFTWIEKQDFPTDREICFAGYVYEDYSGKAIVVYRRDKKLYEVHASHCSCYGLNEPDGHGWHPELTSKEALALRTNTGFGDLADRKWRSLFGKPKSK